VGVERVLTCAQPRHHLAEATERDVVVARHAKATIELSDDGLIGVALLALTNRAAVSRDHLQLRWI